MGLIALPVKEKGEDPEIDERFGRAPFFFLADEKGNYRIVTNGATASASGAGIGVVQMLADEEVTTIISPEIGPKAMDVISQLGIKVFHMGTSIKVSQALERLSQDKLTERKSGPSAGGLRRA